MTEQEIADLAAKTAMAVIDKMKEPIRKLPFGGEAPPEETKFKSFGQFLRAVADMKAGRQMMDNVRKALSEGTDSAGGFTVPEEFRKAIEVRTIESSIVRNFATIMPMATDTLNYPVIKDTTHASSVYGGIIAYWTEEAGTKTVSQPTFGRVKLIARKLTGFTYASDELLEDSAVALESLLLKLFGEGIAWFEDYAFINGNGVGQPLGFLNSGALIAPLRATASTIVLADLGRIMSRIYPGSLYKPSTVWIANPATLPQLINLGSTVVTWQAIAEMRVPTRILGMPLFFTEKVPTLGTTNDIGLYDLSYYLIGDRKDLKVDRSIEYRFATDETTWRFVKRVDGQPLVDSAFTPKAGNTASPFVGLSSATS